MEHIKWIFDGIGVALALGIVRLLSNHKKNKSKPTNYIVIGIITSLLLLVIILQYLLFKGYWIEYISLNRIQITLAILLATSLSILLILIYGRQKFKALKNDYYSVRLELEKHNADLRKELNLVKSSDNFIDDVTKLPNSKAIEHTLLERINRCIDNKWKLSLILVDLDGFKKINKIYSVQGADLLLFKVGQFLKESLRTEDRIIRFRVGDEFLIIASNTDMEGAKGYKNRIKREIVKENFEIGENEIKISVAIGVWEYNLEESFSKYKSQTNEVWKALELDKEEEEKDLM